MRAGFDELVDWILAQVVRMLAERGFVGNKLSGGAIRGEIPLTSLPTHDIVTKHSAAGLTVGDVLTATGATTFAFQTPTGGSGGQPLTDGNGNLIYANGDVVMVVGGA
jgi:hypothetical protein